MHCVVIGGGHAAAQLIASLRQQGWSGAITVISAESQLPYHRPPLSKAFLTGEKTVDQLLIRPASAYEKVSVQFKLSCEAVRIDRNSKTIELNNNETIAYDKLIIATGSRARLANLPGAELMGVHYLRSLADAIDIRASIISGGHAVIVGGGYIGLETAAVLSKMGMSVTLLEMADRILERVTAPEVSAFYSRIHQQQGVRIKTECRAKQLVGNHHVTSVITDSGESIAADLVVVGIGILPNTELAAQAGLTIDDGIVTDSVGRTSDPNIFACGDCAMSPNPFYGQPMRLESVANANEQAKAVAVALCEAQLPKPLVPWFWSDQYDVKLQIAGLYSGYDELVVRGDIEQSRSFAVFYFRDGRVIAADCVNRPKEFMAAKRIIAERRQIAPARLADERILPDDF